MLTTGPFENERTPTTVPDFEAVFEPRKIAVIGVSLTNPFHPANIVYNKNFLRSPAQVLPVNPRGGQIDKKRVYRSVKEIPEGIDAAVVAIKARLVPGLALECAEVGVRSMVVLSGGFSETGPEGVRIQDDLVQTCVENSMTLIGPNCFGVYSPPYIDTFFLPPERTVVPPRGSVAVASQSGAFLVDQIMTRFSGVGIGISTAVSMGNKAMVDEISLLEYFYSDDDTRVICYYIEGITPNAREFCRLAGEVSRKKPVIVYLGAKSQRGQMAASSHTAALAGNLDLMSAALRQNGVLEALNEAEVTSFCKICTFYREPLKTGSIAVITSSGGHGVIAADLAGESGLTLPTFDAPRRSNLKTLVDESLWDIASFDNPVDLTGSASDDDFERVLDYLLGQPDVEGALVCILPYTPMITSFAGSRLGMAVRRHDKPVVAYVPNLAKFGMVLEGFENNGIPVVHSIEEAVQMFKALRMLGRFSGYGP